MTSDPGSTTTDTVKSGRLSPPIAAGGGQWHKLHPLSILTTGLRYLRGLIVPIVFLVISRGFSGGRADLIVTFVIPLVAATGAILFSFIHWMLFRYSLTDGELVIRSGVISRQERVVPFERIQSVDLDEAPLERILGLVRVRVETAASGNSEAKIELHSLGREDAHALRGQLIAARQSSAPSAVDGALPSSAILSGSDSGSGSLAASIADSGAGERIRKISGRELLAAGATSGRVGPAAAIAGIAVQFGTDYVPKSWWDRVPWQGATHANLQLIAGAVIALGLFAWILAIGSTVLTFAGFELRRSGDQLIVQHGLLDRRRRTIPVRRIQAVVMVESLLRQPFGYGELKFENAGHAGGEENESGVLFPFLKMDQMPELIVRACPEFSLPLNPEALQRLPTRALQRYVVPAVAWSLAFSAVVNLVFWNWFDEPGWAPLLVLILVPLSALLAWSQYRTAGWQVTPVHLLMHWRTLTGRNTMVTRRQRLQHRSLSANPFQRRASLATFHASVASGSAGGHFALPQLDRADAERLLAELSPRPRERR